MIYFGIALQPVAQPKLKPGFWGANCFRDNLEKVFSPSNWVRGYLNMGLLGLDLLTLVLGIFDNFLGI